MKRPLLLLLVVATFATLLTLLVMRISRPPEAGAEGQAQAAAASPAAAGAELEAGTDPSQPADLVAPSADAAERAAAPAAAAADAGPKVAIEGRVMAPSGCGPDPEVMVYALDDEMDVDDALRALEPARVRSGGEDSDDEIALPAGGIRVDRVLGRAKVGVDGRYEVEVPAKRKSVHLIAIGRSWFGRATEEFELGGTARQLDLVTNCGGWIAGTATVPAGREASEIEGLALKLETSLEGMGGDIRTTQRARRNAVVHAGSFEFRALPAAATYEVSATPKRLAAESATVRELVAGRETPLALAFRQGGTLRGTVRGTDGAAVVGAEVSANKKGQWFGFDDSAVRKTKSAADGSFELAGVAPGKLDMKATAEGWLLEKPLKVDVVDGAVVDGVAIVLGRGATISGTVRWPDGKPAPDLDVSVEFDRSQMAGMGAFNMLKGARGEAKTDAEGRFAVTGLGPGPFVVEARALPEGEKLLQGVPSPSKMREREHREHRARAELVKPGTEGLELVLLPPTGVRGRVLDLAEAPVKSFTVHANGVGEGLLAEVGQEERTQTFDSEDGAFLLAGLHAGKWKLVAEAEGYSASTAIEFQTPLATDAPEFVVHLERAATVRGIVRTPDGVLIAGATIVVDDGNPEWMRAISRVKPPEAKSGEDGHFELAGLKPGSAAIIARHEDHARSAPLVLELAAGQVVEGVVLDLTRGGRITGEVFHEGKVAPGLMVQVQETKKFSQRMTTTDSKGTFEVAHVDPGTYQVIAMPMRGESFTGEEGEFDPMAMMSKMKMATAEVAEGSDVHLVLGAPPEDPVVVKGTVTMAGAPVGSTTVMFLPEGGKKGLAAFKSERTAKDGTYKITLDGPGAYRVSVQRMSAQMDSQSVHEERRVIPKVPEYAVDITLPEGRISGRVTGTDGKPAGNARVSVVREGVGKPGTMWGGQYHELRTNVDGEYDATGIPAGTYTVKAGGSELGGMLGDASAIGGREIKPGIQVGERDWRQGVDFRLKAPASVEVTVVDDAGRPVSGAVIFARDENGRATESFSFVTTDAAGLAKYGGLSPGRYTFRARTNGASTEDSAPVRVEEGGKGAVKLALEKSSMLLVKVVDGEKLPLVASVEVLDEHGRDVSSQLGLSEMVERFQGGGFDPNEQKFGPFPPGKYKVRVTSESGNTTTKTVTLSGQAERKVTIELD
ncbi:MAG: carboxypeptidase-like regulatory domain-containing protein [Planctomycetota bacterium]|nr:carboxypeptidase-like regulatory domain-containing protein [Planctomycetota bacterium]